MEHNLGKRTMKIFSWSVCKLMQHLQVPHKIKTELPDDPVITLVSIYPRNMKTLIQKDISTRMFTAGLLPAAK